MTRIITKTKSDRLIARINALHAEETRLLEELHAARTARRNLEEDLHEEQERLARNAGLR